MKVSKLKFNPNNPRKIAPTQLEKLKKSIRSFPEMMPLRPIVYDPDTMHILGGNQRLAAIRALGMKEIPDSWAIPASELTDAQKREFVLKDNAMFGDWDWDILQSDWADLDLDAFGIDVPECSGSPSLPIPPEIDETPSAAAVELGKEWGTKTGQIWRLGRHKIMCADCTNAKNIDILIDGNEPDICFTDPPYGIDVVGRDNAIGNGKKYKEVIGDRKAFDPTWLIDRFKNLILWGANYFSNKLPRGQWIVWDKEVAKGLSFSQCELAWMTSKGVRTSLYKCTLNGFIREGESNKTQRYHPTQKPVKLIADILNDYTKEGDLVVDPYLGSGTTLIACEITGRVCLGMEIDPDYVAVTLQRFKDATGIEPELLNV